MIYFGTDGIRGVVGENITQEICFKCGNALASLKDNCKIIIGRDTRKSGSFVLSSFVSGATLGGASVIDVGIIPTPAVSFLVKKHNADFGVVISASHNPAEHNGIKIFDHNGVKISSKTEIEIERKFVRLKEQTPQNMGEYTQKYYLTNDYLNFLTGLSSGLNGLKVVLDCGYGAGYKVATEVFEKLGAEVIKLNCENKGENINNGCGALHPENLAEAVKNNKADVGFAFDGDADRIVVVDDSGDIVDGDQTILFLTEMYKKFGLLKTDTVVGTAQTNIAIEEQLNKIGVKLIRADVGDKFVIEKLVEHNLQIGGEQAGHIILLDHETSGDGVLCAVIVADFLVQTKQKLSNLVFKDLTKQFSKNLAVNDKFLIMNSTALKSVVNECEKMLNTSGRLLVRASGTEQKIRIMVECNNNKLAEEVIAKIESVILS